MPLKFRHYKYDSVKKFIYIRPPHETNAIIVFIRASFVEMLFSSCHPEINSDIKRERFADYSFSTNISRVILITQSIFRNLDTNYLSHV